MAQQQRQNIDYTNASDLLLNCKAKFIQLANGDLDFDKEMFYVMQALRANDYLASIALKDLPSLQTAFFNLATIGLTLESARKLAYLTPRRGKVVYDPSYQGMVHLATMSGAIEWVQAEKVCSNDQFVFNGVGHQPTHIVASPFDDTKRGDVIGYYCTAKTVHGDYLTELMSSTEIDDIRKLSFGSDDNNSPWKNFPHQMGKKCVIKRAANTWPKGVSDRLDQAIQVMNQYDGLKETTGQSRAPKPSKPTPLIQPFQSQDLPKISDEVKNLINRMVDRCMQTGSWHHAETWIKERFAGTDLSYAKHMLDSSKPK